jgi:hypothetical protein
LLKFLESFSFSGFLEFFQFRFLRFPFGFLGFLPSFPFSLLSFLQLFFSLTHFFSSELGFFFGFSGSSFSNSNGSLIGMADFALVVALDPAAIVVACHNHPGRRAFHIAADWRLEAQRVGR